MAPNSLCLMVLVSYAVSVLWVWAWPSDSKEYNTAKVMVGHFWDRVTKRQELLSCLLTPYISIALNPLWQVVTLYTVLWGSLHGCLWPIASKDLRTANSHINGHSPCPIPWLQPHDRPEDRTSQLNHTMS